MTGNRPRVVVCGLGPAGADLMTAAARSAVARAASGPDRLFLRTRRHPAVAELAELAGAASFDHLYEAAATIDEVYAGVVEALVEAAGAAGAAASVDSADAGPGGAVTYVVPGSPAVAERTVELLRADDRVDVEVVPALSFVDLAWVRLGVDPLAGGVRLVDGHRFEADAAGERGPLLVAQCDHRDVLSEIKLALGDVAEAGAAGGEPSAVVLQRLGLPDESVVAVAWHDLDRVVEADHLTSVYLPRLAAPVAGEVAAFAGVVRRLRAECPWDREQTHHTLRRHLLEESYEVLEAIDHVDVEAGTGFDHLEEELGDLLFQVVFHATLAAEEGHFTLADVARGVADKLVGRHPHVFGDVDATTADEVAANWEQLKKAEKGRASVMDGIPAALPALLYATKVEKKAEGAGVDWRSLVAPGDRDGFGARLLGLVDEARAAGVDPETELRLAAERVRDRFRSVEPP